jgi:hypothetical protein
MLEVLLCSPKIKQATQNKKINLRKKCSNKIGRHRLLSCAKKSKALISKDNRKKKKKGSTKSEGIIYSFPSTKEM